MMPPLAIIFDLDGTLLDTLVDIADSANAVLRQLGHPEHDYDRYRIFIGDGVSVLFQRALPSESVTSQEVERCMAGFQREYGARWHVASHPYRGIQELLDVLVAAKLPLAVLSNKPDEFTKKCVQQYFPGVPFVAVLGQRSGVPRKPDPAAAHEIAEIVAVPEKAFLYLGDTATDMQTAQAAGMTAIGAAWGFRTADELRSAGAAAIISEPLELLKLVSPSLH